MGIAESTKPPILFFLSGCLLSFAFWSLLFFSHIDPAKYGYIYTRHRNYVPVVFEVLGISLLLIVDMGNVNTASAEEDNGSKALLMTSIILIFVGIVYSLIIFDEEFACKACDPSRSNGGAWIMLDALMIAFSGILCRMAIDSGASEGMSSIV